MIVKKLKERGRVIAPPDSKIIKSGYVILKPGEEVGEHVTENREEIIVILEGSATVVAEGESREIRENEVVFIGNGKRHNVVNESDSLLRYLYIVAPLG